MQKPPDVGKENSSRVAGKLGEAEHKLVGQCGVCGGHRYSSMCVSSCQTFLHKFHQTLNGEDWGEKNMITARGEQNSICSLLSLLTLSNTVALRALVKIHYT